MQCSICLSDVSRNPNSRIKLPCGHCFHRDCIGKWFYGTQTTCPLCREPGDINTCFYLALRAYIKSENTDLTNVRSNAITIYKYVLSHPMLHCFARDKIERLCEIDMKAVLSSFEYGGGSLSSLTKCSKCNMFGHNSKNTVCPSNIWSNTLLSAFPTHASDVHVWIDGKPSTNMVHSPCVPYAIQKLHTKATLGAHTFRKWDQLFSPSLVIKDAEDRGLEVGELLHVVRPGLPEGESYSLCNVLF